MFNGFSQKTIDFMWGIRLNNNREWFTEHKEEYHSDLEAPMKNSQRNNRSSGWSCTFRASTATREGFSATVHIRTTFGSR